MIFWGGLARSGVRALRGLPFQRKSGGRGGRAAVRPAGPAESGTPECAEVVVSYPIPSFLGFFWQDYSYLAGQVQDLPTHFQDVYTNKGYIALAYNLGLMNGTSSNAPR